MVDSINQSRVVVHSGGTADHYIIIPLSQLDSVTSTLKMNGVPFWVDSTAISLNGEPQIIFVNVAPEWEVSDVQPLLDAAI